MLIQVPQHVQAKLFTPFFTTKETGKGTGLGLHVCDGIVKQHNGMIKVRSQPGSGSVFSVIIPVLDVPPREVECWAAAKPKRPAGPNL